MSREQEAEKLLFGFLNSVKNEKEEETIKKYKEKYPELGELFESGWKEAIANNKLPIILPAVVTKDDAREFSKYIKCWNCVCFIRAHVIGPNAEKTCWVLLDKLAYDTKLDQYNKMFVTLKGAEEATLDKIDKITNKPREESVRWVHYSDYHFDFTKKI